VSYVLEQAHGYRVPKGLAVELSRSVQAATDDSGKELAPSEICAIFECIYLRTEGAMVLLDYEVQHPAPDHCHLKAKVRNKERTESVEGEGRGAIEAFVHALETHSGAPLQVADFSEHALGAGSDAEAVAYVKLLAADGKEAWGAGRDRDIVTASLRAVVGAANRLSRDQSAGLVSDPVACGV
jgi:2-isopropylmalate synthase